MIDVFGHIYTGKKSRLIHLDTVEGEAAANKIAVDFLRERIKKGLKAEVQAIDEDGNTVLHLGVDQPKPTIVGLDELGLIEKGGRFR